MTAIFFIAGDFLPRIDSLVFPHGTTTTTLRLRHESAQSIFDLRRCVDPAPVEPRSRQPAGGHDSRRTRDGRGCRALFGCRRCAPGVAAGPFGAASPVGSAGSREGGGTAPPAGLPGRRRRQSANRGPRRTPIRHSAEPRPPGRRRFKVSPVRSGRRPTHRVRRPALGGPPSAGRRLRRYRSCRVSKIVEWLP